MSVCVCLLAARAQRTEHDLPSSAGASQPGPGERADRMVQEGLPRGELAWSSGAAQLAHLHLSELC